MDALEKTGERFMLSWLINKFYHSSIAVCNITLKSACAVASELENCD